MDWSIFDKKYPVKDGIVMALPPELAYDVQPKLDAKNFFDVHSEVMQGRQGKDFLSDKSKMAKIQKDFYDRMAVGYEHMQDTDKVFNLRVQRAAHYDMARLKGRKVLFVGGGDSRTARIFAQHGYDVVVTDISYNMLKVGKERNDRLGLEMTYVAHNAEIAFPFKSEQFEVTYSTCVINHIADWRNYISEKIRCLCSGGVLLERMPNADLWSFWNQMGELNDGMEVKAKYCTPTTARAILNELNLHGEIWMHDREVQIVWPPLKHLRGISSSAYLTTSHLCYYLRSAWEDHVQLPIHDDGKGIYVLFQIIKD